MTGSCQREAETCHQPQGDLLLHFPHQASVFPHHSSSWTGLAKVIALAEGTVLSWHEGQVQSSKNGEGAYVSSGALSGP
jgi:hypothetical protein